MPEQATDSTSERELRALIAILRELGQSADPWSRLDRVVAHAAAAVAAETGSLFLKRGRPPRLEARVIHGRAVARDHRFGLALGEAIPGWVAEHDQPLVLDAPSGDPRFQPFPDGAVDGASIRNLICVPLRDELGVAGALELVNHASGFGAGESDMLLRIATETAVILRKAKLVKELQDERLLLKQLNDINKTLVSSLNLKDVLWRIVDAVGQVIEFEAVGIFLCRDGRNIEEVVERGYDPDSVHLLHQKVGEGLVGYVVSTGEPLYVPDVGADRRYVCAREQTRSELVAPMISKGKVIGAFNVESDTLDAYTEEDLRRMVAFADQVTVAVESARLYERALLARRFEEELSIARTIQLSFLPAQAPEVPGLDLAGINIPSLQVGGDYYDFISVASGQLGLAIGDVSGKGVAAGLIMASFRASLLAEVRNNYSISTILAKVNRLLCESTELDRYVTAIYGVLDLSQRRFTYSCAGHNPALLIRADGGVEELGEGGTVLGAFRESTYIEGVRGLRNGDMLVLYTDGVTEAESRDGELYGSERLAELAVAERHRPAAEVARSIESAARQFAMHRGIQDDLTLMVVRVVD